MAIKDIVVHVDPSAACEQRLRLVVGLAHRFGANVTGVFVLPSPDALAQAGGIAASTLIEITASLERGAAEAEDQFRALLRRHGLQSHWHRERGPAAPAVTQWARFADLVVLGQSDPEYPTVLEQPEDVVLACGRPALVLPHKGRFEHAGENMLIGWNGSAQAARAAHDAVSLVSPSASITVLTIDPETDAVCETGHELASHFERCGFHSAADHGRTVDVAVADALLARAAALGADVLVMGAYSHSRLREFVLGGTTRDMLRRMTVPVLMAA